MNIIGIVIILLLGIVVYQDFKYRAISWFLIPCLLSLFVLRWNSNDLIVSVSINLLFVALQLLLLSIYISIKNKRLTYIIDSYLGLGDVLFIITICTGFDTPTFFVLYLCGLVFSILTFSLYRQLNKKASPEIPLAGLMSIVLIAFLIYLNFHSKDALQEHILTLLK